MTRNKIFIVGPPFPGHLHPLLGIGRRLQAASEVAVLTTPGGLAAAEADGLAGIPILARLEKAVWEIAEPGNNVRGNPVGLFRQLRANVALLAGLKAELDALFRIHRPDLVIADFTVPVAGISATQQGIPWWTTLPSPCVFESPDGPPAYFGGLTPATTRGQKILLAVLRTATRQFKQLMWLVFRRQFRAIGFEGIYRADGSEAVYSPQRILALGIPELEFPRSYPPHFHLIGPVLHTPPDSSPAPRFANDGRPHVLVTLGTHLRHAKVDLAAVIRGIASRHPGLVFHFTHGSTSAGESRAVGNFHEYPHISYTAHLSRYDLVVHHAGAGILNHCLLHGKPSVVHPLDFDQFDNAARLVAAGVAVRTRNMENIEHAVVRVLDDTSFRTRCGAMQEILRRYDAPETIAAMVEADRQL